jgi:hypothetical protein
MQEKSATAPRAARISSLAPIANAHARGIIRAQRQTRIREPQQYRKFMQSRFEFMGLAL